MRYVGNASLSEQIQERILTTFQQTLSLAQEGNRQEALLGCDFVLRLDPLFEPARQLQTRLGEGEGPIDVDDLAESVNGGAQQAADGAPAEPQAATAIESEPEPLAQPVDDLPARLALLLEQRNFEDLQSLVVQNQDRVAADPSLQELARTGIERLEALPYVESFLESSEKAKEIGDLEAAEGHLEKARELDPTHPRIITLEADLAGSASTTVEDLSEESPVDDLMAGAVVDAPVDLGSDTDWLDELEEKPEPSEAAEEEEAKTDAGIQLEPIEDEPSLGLETEPIAEPAAEFSPESELLMPEGGEPEAQLDSESEGRIDQLLAEGQEAFENSEYQTAIDAWSRIFLIDIDHAEASRRIELARKLKAEVERQVEEAFHEGIQLVETGKSDEAKVAFKKVLEMHPGHMGAREYLDKLETGDVAATADTAPDATPDLVPVEDLDSGDGDAAAAEAVGELDLAPDLAPEPDAEFADPYQTPFESEIPVVEQPKKKRSFALIGTAVLVLVLATGWFLYSKRQSIFPNSDPQQQQGVQKRVDPIERARQLHEEGKTAMAINVLKRLPPDDPEYAEGQSLIEAWEMLESPAQVVDAGPSEDDLLRRDALLEESRAAGKRRENLVALELLEQADAISPLDGADLDFQTLTIGNLESLDDEIQLFEQGDWEYALPGLWRLHEADASNPDVSRLMVDSYYNLGLRDLQRGDTRDAAEKFQEALRLAPNDPELMRLSEFASAYTRRPSDLLYRIFVKYHPFR
jgi:tetratricopeptide (TPR) repeat protein